MTDPLFLAQPYLRDCPATVTGLTPEGGIILDRSIFYPTGGGQPGDSGQLVWTGGSIDIATTVKGEEGAQFLVAAEPVALPAVGASVMQHLDWERRHRHMRVHTALHLLSVVIPLPVTGGAIAADKGRLDFDMPESPGDPEDIAAQVNALIARDLSVTDEWITEAAFDANPGLVKTLSVKPPRGAGTIRLVRIADAISLVDLQPCGGTHVARTSEIGRVTMGRIEKKGRQNRRVTLLLT